MSAIGTPATVPKVRKLPFKRTVKRKSAEVPESNPAPKNDDDDDVLNLFKRSGDFFDEQQRLAAAQSAKKRKPTPPGDTDEEIYNTQAEAQLVRESSESHTRQSPEKQHHRTKPNKSKRLRATQSGDEEDKEEDAQKSHAARRDSSALKYPSTSSRKSPPKARTSPGTRSAAKNTSPVAISLDDSDDEMAFTSPSRGSGGGKGSLRDEMMSEEGHTNGNGMDSDSEMEEAAGPSSNDDELDEMTRRFVQEARERMEKEKAARLAREADPKAPAGETEAQAIIMIESHVQGTKSLTTRVKLSQQMRLVKSSWVLYNVKKKAPWSPETLDTMFFTWKGRKIYPHTTLASLGIKPDSKGKFYPSWESNRNGFVGWDKVHFEAWTQDLFEDAERDKERERMRQLGELDDASEPEPASSQEEPEAGKQDPKIRLICRSKNHGTQNMTVPSRVTISIVATAFRRMKQIPEDKVIVIHFDGEALDPSSTLEDAEIEDEDCVEVHIT